MKIAIILTTVLLLQSCASFQEFRQSNIEMCKRTQQCGQLTWDTDVYEDYHRDQELLRAIKRSHK